MPSPTFRRRVADAIIILLPDLFIRDALFGKNVKDGFLENEEEGSEEVEQPDERGKSHTREA